MTIDEVIKICEEDAEKIGGNPQSDRHAERCKKIAEWLKELKELRSIIEACNILAVDAFAVEKLCKELKEAKRLLKLTIDTNYSLHKSCYNCSHFTSDCNCDIGKYLYGTGEKECEWEWKHMGKIINFLHD